MTAAARARFEAKVDRSPGLGPHGECHEWTASVNDSGYGKFKLAGRGWMRAHRVAWFLATGEWPALPVLHTCDNPRCVRFAHLLLGTQADNQRDMRLKGRASRGEHRPLAKLKARDVPKIRALRRVESQATTAQRFGVSRATISDVQTGRGWSWVR